MTEFDALFKAAPKPPAGYKGAKEALRESMVERNHSAAGRILAAHPELSDYHDAWHGVHGHDGDRAKQKQAVAKHTESKKSGLISNVKSWFGKSGGSNMAIDFNSLFGVQEPRRLNEFEAIFKAAPKPPKGFTPIPNSKHGGYHRQVGTTWHTWYPETGHAEKFTDDEHHAQKAKMFNLGLKKRSDALAEEAALHPQKPIEEWSNEEIDALPGGRDGAMATEAYGNRQYYQSLNASNPSHPTHDPKRARRHAANAAEEKQELRRAGFAPYAPGETPFAAAARVMRRHEAANPELYSGLHNALADYGDKPIEQKKWRVDVRHDGAPKPHRTWEFNSEADAHAHGAQIAGQVRENGGTTPVTVTHPDGRQQRVKVMKGRNLFEAIFKAAPKPPKGFTPIPNSKHGGYHKRVGTTYHTWYPTDGAGGGKDVPEEATRPPHKDVVASLDKQAKDEPKTEAKAKPEPAKSEAKPAADKVTTTGKTPAGEREGAKFYDVDPTLSTGHGGVADAARVGVPGNVAIVKDIPRLPRLTDDERAIETKFADMVEANPEALADHFYELSKKERFVFETDNAKSLLHEWDRPDLPKDAKGAPVHPERAKVRALYNTSLHQAANAIAKRAFIKRLDEIANLPEEQKKILVTCGGVAAGKGSALGARPDLASSVAATWDAAGEQNATENPWLLDECKKRGIKATFLFVHAEPQEAWPGVVERAKGIGRMVDARLFADSYGEGAKNVNAFYEANKDDPHADFVFAKFAGRDPTAVGNAITKAKDKATADGDTERAGQLEKALADLKADPASAGKISMANKVNVPAEITPGMPEEALKVKSDDVYNWANGHIDSLRESLPDYIYKGATAGRRIWKK